MSKKPYGIFCPTSKACEVLEPRWTIQIIGEMWGGATRFNEIRRGIPSISPALLSKRLKELQAKGLVERHEDRATGVVHYFRTPMAIELEPILVGLAKWAQRHVAADVALADRDADVLMWDLRHKVKPERMPHQRNVVRFHFADSEGQFDTYWVIAKRGEPPEICASDPKLDVDLYVETEVTALTGVYLGRIPLNRAIDDGRLFLSGDPRLARTFADWLEFSDYSSVNGVATVE